MPEFLPVPMLVDVQRRAAGSDDKTVIAEALSEQPLSPDTQPLRVVIVAVRAFVNDDLSEEQVSRDG